MSKQNMHYLLLFCTLFIPSKGLVKYYMVLKRDRNKKNKHNYTPTAFNKNKSP